jgi:hypothetical protein
MKKDKKLNTIIENRIIEILNENNQIINESSISRIEKWVLSNDIAGISAFRGKLIYETENTLNDFGLGHVYTKPENIVRNRNLKATLLKLGYGVTKIAGSYVEQGGDESQEESYIVVNLNDDPKFKENLFKLSEYYNQDSFLFKAKDDEDAYLIGTNNSDFPGYGNEINQGKFNKNVSAKYMSRINNQGFAFSKNDEDNPLSTDNPFTFSDRKKQRIEHNKNIIKESCDLLMIETFDVLQNNSKHLCDVYSKKIIETLNLL